MGIGTKFLKEIEEYVAERDMTQIFLRTERNVPAYQFYEKNGFIELPEQVSFAKKVGL